MALIFAATRVVASAEQTARNFAVFHRHKEF